MHFYEANNSIHVFVFSNRNLTLRSFINGLKLQRVMQKLVRASRLISPDTSSANLVSLETPWRVKTHFHDLSFTLEFITRFDFIMFDALLSLGTEMVQLEQNNSGSTSRELDDAAEVTKQNKA